MCNAWYKMPASTSSDCEIDIERILSEYFNKGFRLDRQGNDY